LLGHTLERRTATQRLHPARSGDGYGNDSSHTYDGSLRSLASDSRDSWNGMMTMRHPRMVPAPTALALDLQLTIPTPYPTTPARSTQPWRSRALLHGLYMWVVSCLRPAPCERRWSTPESRGWEAPTDILARQYPTLYLRACCGV
jgi:hypothetical protein